MADKLVNIVGVSVLCEGGTFLLYSRSQAEMAHTCRGTINLAGAFIDAEDSCNFVISNGGTQIFYMRANSEVERQRWVTALELAKAKAIKLLESGVIICWVFFNDKGVHCITCNTQAYRPKAHIAFTVAKCKLV